MAHRRLLRVGDAEAGRHQRQLARTEGDVAAEGVPVVHLALEQPRHRLQPGVRVRRHLHPGAGGDVVGPVVVDEGPGPDEPPSQGGQQPADAGALAEQHLLARQQVQRGAGRGLLEAAQLLGRRSSVEVAHRRSSLRGKAAHWPDGRLASLAPDGPVRNRRAGDALRRDRAEPAGLEVGERVQDLLAGVHDERPVHGDRLADRRAAEDHDVQRRRPRLLVDGAVDRDRVAGAEDGELAGADRRAVDADRARRRRARRPGR